MMAYSSLLIVVKIIIENLASFDEWSIVTAGYSLLYVVIIWLPVRSDATSPPIVSNPKPKLFPWLLHSFVKTRRWPQTGETTVPRYIHTLSIISPRL